MPVCEPWPDERREGKRRGLSALLNVCVHMLFAHFRVRAVSLTHTNTAPARVLSLIDTSHPVSLSHTLRSHTLSCA